MNSLGNFYPSPPVFWAIIAGISVPIFLIVYSHRPWKISILGKRFIVSTISGFVCWAISVIFSIEYTLRIDAVLEIVAGLFLFFAIVLATWFVWSLVAYSFRFNILLGLDKLNAKTDIDELISGYSNGLGLQPVMKGRLTLLRNLNMIELQGEEVFLTNKNGRFITFWMELIMKFWGLNKGI